MIVWVRVVLKRTVVGDYPHPDDHTIRITDTPGFKHSLYYRNCKFIFSLENIIFQVVVVGQFHSFTCSLLHFPLDIWKPGGSSHMKRQGMLQGQIQEFLIRGVQTLVQKGLLDSFETDYFSPTPPLTNRGCML